MGLEQIFAEGAVLFAMDVQYCQIGNWVSSKKNFQFEFNKTFKVVQSSLGAGVGAGFSADGLNSPAPRDIFAQNPGKSPEHFQIY